MKKNRLFNKTISLSLIFALYFSMSASAFADLDQETGVVEPTSETTVVENSAEEVSSDAQNNIETTPSEDNLQNVTDENVASTESGTTETNSVVEDVKQIAEDIISKVTDKEVTSEGEAIDSTENKDLIDKAEAEDKLDEEKTEKDKSDEELEKEKLEKEKLEKEKLEKEKLEKEECEHEFKYESNKDGTHKVTCSECEDFEEYTESCEYDEEGVCTKCGYHRLPDPVLVYEDDEVIVTVSGAVPENADLKVTPIKADVEETPYINETPVAIKTLRESRSDVIRAIMEPWIPGEMIDFTELARALNSLEVTRSNRKLLAMMLYTYKNHNGHMLWNENSLGLLRQILFDILDISQKTYDEAIDTGNPDMLRRIVISKTTGFMIEEIDEVCNILTMEVQL